MRTLPPALFRLSLSYLIVGVGVALAGISQAQTSSDAANRKPIVVELFTSEGCSSCPPADLLLQKLVQSQPVPGADIIALEEHVDYWNHDGWTDPYSSAEWTQRQVVYGSIFKKDAYTPEMVVDGQSQFLGNDPREALVEIEQAAGEAKTDVSITPEKPDSKGVQQFTVSVKKLAGNTSGDTAEVWLAVTEDGLHSDVSRGENAERMLDHIATLRSLRKIGTANTNDATVSFQGTSAVKFNSHWNPEKIRVTILVQERRNRRILGAASIKIRD